MRFRLPNGRATNDSPSSKERHMAKTPDTFKSFVSREHSRLTKARDAALGRKKQLDRELSEIENELGAIRAYEQAKSKVPARPAAGRSVARAGRRAPRGEKRRSVLELIQKSGGLTRGEILASLGVKGNKSAEQSVSNALTALKKQNLVASRDRKYMAP
jgi:DNA-binding transcriptional ArsR family regulator